MHLQIAVHEMFRHRSNFYLTWIRSREQGGGRVSVLLSSGVHLVFAFDGSRVPRINPNWVDQLIASAMTGTGLVLLPEPSESPTKS